AKRKLIAPAGALLCRKEFKGVLEYFPPRSGRGIKIRSLRAMAHIRYPPNDAISVIGEQYGAIFGLGNANGPAPYVRIIDDEPGDKILVFARGQAVFHGGANDLVAGAFCTIP